MESKPNRVGFVPPSVPILSNWTVARVRSALVMHEAGDFSASGILADALGRNPRIDAALNTRVLGGMGLPFKWLESTSGAAVDRGRLGKWLKANWRTIVPVAVEAELRRAALLMGFAPAELVYAYVDGDWIPRLKAWHPSLLRWDDTAKLWQVQTQTGFVPFTHGDGHWFAFGYGDLAPWMRGVVRCLALPDAIRSYAVRDWARWSEVHGLPIKVAKVPQSATDPEKDRFFSDVARLGAESTVMAPFSREAGFDIALVEPKDPAHEGFASLISRCDSDVCIALLGQAQTQGEAPGVYVPKTVGDGMRRDFQEADAVLWGDAARSGIVQPVAVYNFSRAAASAAPTPFYDASVPADLTAGATMLKTLGEGISALTNSLAPYGVRPVASRLAERFGIETEPAPEPAAPPPRRPGAPGAPPSGAVDPGAPDGALGRPRGALARLPSTTAALVGGQGYADDVADRALALAPDAASGVLAEVLAAVDESTGYDNLRALLLERLAGSLPDATLRELLSSAVLMAQAAGAWSVSREAGDG